MKNEIEENEENSKSKEDSCTAEFAQEETTAPEEESSVSTTDTTTIKVTNEKIKKLVSTEISSLEQQLENVQRQLFALKQLPSEIENHLRTVSDQLHKIMELSGMQRYLSNENCGGCKSSGDRNSRSRLCPDLND